MRKGWSTGMSKAKISLCFKTVPPLKVKIADLRVAMKRIDAVNSVATQRVGAIQWMAPEMFCNHCPDEMTDVYSFGVIIYDVATESTP